jgi:hypothetical protein
MHLVAYAAVERAPMRMVGISTQGKTIRPLQVAREAGEMPVAYVATEADLRTDAVIPGK